MSGTSRIRSWLEQLLHTHDTPHRTALAYAIGVFLGFSPILGLHTVLGLALAFLFGLNRIAVVLGVYSNLPWLVPAYYTLATIAGAAVLRVDLRATDVDIHPIGLAGAMGAISAALRGEVPGIARELAPLMWSYVLGSTVGAIILALVAYRVSLAMILAHRKRVAERAEEMG